MNLNYYDTQGCVNIKQVSPQCLFISFTSCCTTQSQAAAIQFQASAKFQIVPKDLLLKSLGIGIHVFKINVGTPHHGQNKHSQLLGRMAHLRNEVLRSERKSVFIPLQIQSFQAWVFLRFLPLLGRMAHVRNEVLRSEQTTKMGFISIIW